MNKLTQKLLIIIGILDIVAAAAVSTYFVPGKDVLITVIPGMLVFDFFMYKLLTGWLIINMSVKLEAQRDPIKDNEELDHLALSITLSKGNIDSLWMDDIRIRLKKINAHNEEELLTNKLLRPFNITKYGEDAVNYWGGDKEDFYTISSGEETTFSAYTTVDANAVIVVELLVLGTRLFNRIESRDSEKKRIQWRSSIVVLPCSQK